MSGPATMNDAAVVAAQLGRAPQATWRVVRRCSFDRPTVIANAPRTAMGAPFPTLYWLTCPHLVDAIGRRESAGAASGWSKRLRDDAHLRFEVAAADHQYRAARQIEGQGDDPCADVGVGGQRDPYATKCLHAHAASYLAGIPDPVGRDAIADGPLECDRDDCRDLLIRYGSDGIQGEGAGE